MDLFKKCINFGGKVNAFTKVLDKIHFMKNDNKDSVEKMPIHTLKVWVHKLTMVVFMFKDPRKKHVIGLVCSIDKISDELSLTMAKEGFWFKKLKDKTTQDNHDRWDEIFEVFQIEKEKFARDC